MRHFRTCPWWLTPTFDNPLRRFVHNPDEILGDLVMSGQTVVDLGCGMGYFTLAMAKLVAPNGRVIAVDLQSQMLTGTRRRAKRAGLLPWILFHQCTPEQINLVIQADFVLAFWMVHEAQNPLSLLRQVFDLLKPRGKFLLVEPKVHVSKSSFERTTQVAQSVGLVNDRLLSIRLSRAVLFIKDS